MARSDQQLLEALTAAWARDIQAYRDLGRELPEVVLNLAINSEGEWLSRSVVITARGCFSAQITSSPGADRVSVETDAAGLRALLNGKTTAQDLARVGRLRIDGPGRALAALGPCFSTTQSLLTTRIQSGRSPAEP